MTTFIGDVHGKFSPYTKIIKKHPDTIQVGDMGVGFFHRGFRHGTSYVDRYEEYLMPSGNPPYDRMVENNARFIRGNHDNPGVCKKHTQYIPDGHVEGDMMFVGGALSIDRHMRRVNESYWEDEELSYGEFMDIQEKYLDIKPRIMVTHECPEAIAQQMFNYHKLDDPSRTRQAFESMWEMHKPEIWIFGHWHDRRDWVIMGTRFICLEELGTITL